MRNLRALLVNDASLAGHHGSALVSAQAVRLAGAAGIQLVAGWDWPSAEKVLSGPQNFDLVVVNGEGSIHHDSRTARRISKLARMLKSRGIPAYLINASEEANSPEIHEGLAAFRLRYVRDEASRASLARAGIDAVVVPDLTLSWEQAPVASCGGGLVVTDASDDRKSALLLDLAQRWGAQPITLRTAPPWPARGSGMRRVAFELKGLASRLAKASPRSWRYAGALRSLPKLAGALTQAGAAVCGRYHGVCLALRLKLPFLAVEGNIGKIHGLLGDIGLVGRMTTLEALRDQAEPPRISPFSDVERAMIDAFLQGAAQRARRMFEEIGADARRL
jgi:polysaccharide pyruvyl transferase WcaK-like protein